MITKGYKFRLYPNKDQQDLIEKTFGCCRFVYNYFLNQRSELWKNSKTSIGRFDQIKQLPILKSSEETQWLKEVDSVALQASVEDLDRAYQRFFKKTSGYPKFKNKRDSKQSYTTKNTAGSIKIINNHIQLPKLGLVRFDNHQPTLGRIKRVTITRSRAGHYYVSIICDNVPYEQQEKTGALLGIDLGLKSFITTNTGVKITPQRSYVNAEKKLAKLQRQLSRKPRDGKNREKARIKLATYSEHVANVRSDYLHKLSRSLVNDYDVICCEDLNVSGMIKNHKLAKSISDASWSTFINMLSYKCDWEDKKLIKIDRFYASSQICFCCGYKNSDVKDLSVRSWTCPNCNTQHDRDVNAAKNILKQGLTLLNP